MDTTICTTSTYCTPKSHPTKTTASTAAAHIVAWATPALASTCPPGPGVSPLSTPQSRPGTPAPTAKPATTRARGRRGRTSPCRADQPASSRRNVERSGRLQRRTATGRPSAAPARSSARRPHAPVHLPTTRLDRLHAPRRECCRQCQSHAAAGRRRRRHHSESYAALEHSPATAGVNSSSTRWLPCSSSPQRFA